MRNISFFLLSLVLLPLYNSVVSANVISEKLAQFFKENNYFSLGLLNDIHLTLNASFLRKIGQSLTVVSEVFSVAQLTVKCSAAVKQLVEMNSLIIIELIRMTMLPKSRHCYFKQI